MRTLEVAMTEDAREVLRVHEDDDGRVWTQAWRWSAGTAGFVPTGPVIQPQGGHVAALVDLLFTIDERLAAAGRR